MKTISPIGTPSIYALIGLLAFTAVSCGSYQNSSYYDSDGIYGDDKKRSESVTETQSSNQYKEYFGNLKQEEILVDVDNYSSVPDSANSRAQSYDSYPGWGSDSENVTVNVYTNAWGYNYWPSYWYGPGWGWGFNSWYGPSWGLGWNSWYGWGWGGYSPYYAGFYSPYYYGGWNNGYYGNHYVHQPGRRGSSYTSGVRGNNGRSYYSGTRTSVRQNPDGTRTYNGTRSFTPRSNNVRTQPTGTPRPDYTTPRSNNVRQNSTPTRSYSPSSSGGGRSSGGSYGGSRSGGGRR